MCASGARSPDAPAEPWAGTTGIKSASSSASSMATVSGRTPEAPWAEARELERHHQPDDRRGRRLTHAGRMRQHDVALQGFEIGGSRS